MRHVGKHKALTKERVGKGQEAGYIALFPSGDKQYVVTLEDKKYFVSDIFWIMQEGHIPSGQEVYHLDGDSLNNKWDNLALRPSKGV